MPAGPAGLLLRLQAPHAIAPHAPRPKRHHREAARACSIAATVAVPHVAGTQNRQEFKSSGRAAGSIRRPGPRQKPSEAPSAGLWGSEAPQTALVRSTGARARGPARRLTAPGGSALPARPFPPLRPPHPPGGRNPGGRARGHRAHTDRLPEATSSPRGATAASPKRLRRGRQARRHLPPEAAPHLAAPTATATAAAAAAAAALTGEEAAESAQPSRLLSRDKLPRSKGPPRLTRQPSPPRRTRAQAPPLGRAGRRAGHAGSRSFPARSWGGGGAAGVQPRSGGSRASPGAASLPACSTLAPSPSQRRPSRRRKAVNRRRSTLIHLSRPQAVNPADSVSKYMQNPTLLLRLPDGWEHPLQLCLDY
ncbi:uncharacterized protein LOC144287754 isoform X2 [Canis aureus]